MGCKSRNLPQRERAAWTGRSQGAGGRSRAGDSAGDSSARVGSSDARPAGAGGVRQVGTLALPNPRGSVNSGHRRNGRPSGCRGGTERVPGRLHGRTPVNARSCERRRRGRGSESGRAGACLRPDDRPKAGDGAEGARRPRRPEGERSRSRLQPQPGPDPGPGPLTRCPAPRARSNPATAEATPINNTPHPLRAGTSGVRHLTSGGAGRGMDRTKCRFPLPAQRAPRGAGNSSPTTQLGFVLTVLATDGRGGLSGIGNPERITDSLFISHRWYRLHL